MVNERRADQTDREAQIAAARRAEAPILKELAELGFHLKSLSELYSRLRDMHPKS